MTRNVLLVSLLAGLAACNSIEERQIANGSYDYLKREHLSAPKLPEGVDTPEYTNDFAIPNGEKQQQILLGKKLKVVAPHVVMPMVTGSHIEEGSKEATVWFDQITDDKPLDNDIWDNLIGFLEKNNIGVLSFDKDKQVLLTDWFVYNDESNSSWLDWDKGVTEVAARFEFTLTKKSHGRSAALHVELKEYKESRNGEVVAGLADANARANEVNILNRVIANYRDQRVLTEVKRIQEIREGLQSEIGFNAKGQPAYIVDANYTVTWPRLLLVFRKLGFDVKDLDQTAGLIFVEYKGVDESWWDSLWGSGANELDLKKDDYRVQLEQIDGNKTAITFMNEDNEPFAAEKVKDLYDVFSDVMSQKNLDI
ncbi:outer membrane protein assembly factor BamC [Neptunicella marina]|uniref:Outer membrane protein assembly factor BamC n=1 Tax=Neptunicella marina TaxID=2125989 RepID=A0A8J6IZ27_9ALTE|nr:outer membrane protein assembly factor BamC [Neptunicella marina]MBC3767478.1 outer membrane protein assembly factor BamC [Neptunicella marina]